MHARWAVAVSVQLLRSSMMTMMHLGGESCTQLVIFGDLQFVVIIYKSNDLRMFVFRIFVLTIYNSNDLRIFVFRMFDTIAWYKQPVRRHSEIVAETLNIRPRTYRRLRRIGAPLLLFQMLHFIFKVAPEQYRPESQFVHCCEFYSGIQTIVNKFASEGFAASPFDFERDNILENACSDG